jgi:lipopolysaccharide transport system ATP-binding protein
MSDDIAIKVENLSKCYQIYDQPRDRLKQMILPRLQRAVGAASKPYFREFWALKDVSFEVKKGETVGIIGRNGSGKSTLLQIICGTLNQSNGSVTTHGRIAALLELGSGFNPEFTGRENVYMNASVLGLTKYEIDVRFDVIAAFADIGDFIEQPVKTYSSGMMVRLAFAVIAHVDADMLVIDEALAVGDAFFTQKCMRFLRHFMERGTVLFVSHDTGAVINLCNKVIWLEHGAVKAFGDPKTVSEDYLASLYQDVSAREDKRQETRPDSDTLKKNAFQHDPRWDLINTSTLRNDLIVFSFKPEHANGFGHGSAEIKAVLLLNENGVRIHQCVGGEVVELRIEIHAVESICKPIVGFSFKDRLGQVLFGDNTYLTYESQEISVSQGKTIVASFCFQMPMLPQGDYSIATAVATGTQIEHRQEHWIHDALIVRSLSSSVSTGLVGIPMRSIVLQTAENY